MAQVGGLLLLLLSQVAQVVEVTEEEVGEEVEMVHHFAFFALGFPSYRSPTRSFF